MSTLLIWPSSSTIITPQNPQNPNIFSFSLTSAPHNLRFTSLAPKLSFSSQPLYDAVPRDDEDDDSSTIGDCLVYEEGIFDDPYLQTAPKFQNDDVRVSNKNDSKDNSVSAENLIPEKWLDVQKELNISKKERRKLSRELEYGRKVEKRRQALRPIIDSEVYERSKEEKLRQLRPLVLDEPELRRSGESAEGGGERSSRGRVAPRNPRLAVYGGGLEDVAEVFESGRYIRGDAERVQGGTRKLFSKEEKVLLNRRVPDLAVATSGKWHPLHTLAASGEFYLVNSLLKHNLDINAPDKDGLTAIHKAILGKKQAIFNLLLRESANPFIRDKEGATLMHYAIRTSSSQMIKILLLYNVNINLQDNDGWTPLHLAVQSRRTDIVRLLLIKGADKTLTNKDGLTALDLCLHSGRDTRTYELIKLIKRLPR